MKRMSRSGQGPLAYLEAGMALTEGSVHSEGEGVIFRPGMASIMLFSLHCMTVMLSSSSMNQLGSSLRTLTVRLLLVIPAFLAALVLSAPSAQADSVVTIVNVGTSQNPVTVQLTSGSYSVAPIYGSPGSYTAWFGGAWHVTYNLQFQGTERFLGTTWRFDAPIWAFANGTGTTFNLSSSGPVTFSIDTTGHGDASGGLSFQVRPDPWPVAPGKWVVDVDAYFGSHAVGVSLGPGSYTVTPIDMFHGGAFTAWWTGNNWQSNYYVDVSGGLLYGGSIADWRSPGDAFANSYGTNFTLGSAATVYFGIQDQPDKYGDNGGGLSFLVTSNAVPLPPSLLLLAPGLVGLVALRRRLTK